MSNSTKRPDFAELVKKELGLTPGEAQEFLKLEVTHLAVLSSRMSATAPEVGHFESNEFSAYAEQYEAEYTALLKSASPRVIQAMRRYFERDLAWLRAQRSADQE